MLGAGTSGDGPTTSSTSLVDVAPGAVTVWVVNATWGTVTAVERIDVVLDAGMVAPMEGPVLYVQGTVRVVSM